ncbi:hypothetical protein LCGC14_1603560 [marine sediment metagenome]|uniref:Uncharacterized protein n=1 Tax=marine sediment metagenome TaxID=412755 RepID=A0A0F9IX10_9ZZZZ
MPEHDGMSEAQIANMRLDRINGDLIEFKDSIKENNVLIRGNSDKIGKTNVGVASLKSEVRIIGTLIIGLIMALIGAVVSQIM